MHNVQVNIAKSQPVKVRVSRHNATDWPKEYSCNFIEPGLVSYEDVGAGKAMMRRETLAAMANSFIGKPVLIDHQDVRPDNLEEHKHGVVTRVWEEGGWWWCTFILDTDESKQKVQNGYSVSCAFDVLKTSSGGEWHAIAYDEEITEGAYTHLALVTNPRYEGCRIYTNSKGAAKVTSEKANEKSQKKETDSMEQKNLWNFKVRSKENNVIADMKKDPALLTVQTKKGPMSVKALIEAKNKREASRAAAQESDVLTIEDEFTDEAGVKHSIKELVNSMDELENAAEKDPKDNAKDKEEKDNGKKCSCSKAPKENAMPEDHEKECSMYKNAKDDDDKKDNAKDDDAKDKKDNSRVPADGGHFARVNGLRDQMSMVSGSQVIETRGDKVKRGNDRYGKKK